jgi:aryl-alcohol dehydrogenase-like predicted oxidoreductase
VRTRRFGDTDLEASEIGFGTWALGSTWWGDVPEDDGERLLQIALELGITFFETGDAYGQGRNEELVGRVLAPHRDRVQISTKFGYELDSDRQVHKEGERPQRWDGAFVRTALEGSLRRLGTDFVDLYQLHNPRMDAIDHDECFATLDELRAEGKIRHYGVALGPAIGWREEGLEAIRRRDIASVQTVYNLLEQDPGRDLIAAAAEQGVYRQRRLFDARRRLRGAAPTAVIALRPDKPMKSAPGGFGLDQIQSPIGGQDSRGPICRIFVLKSVLIAEPERDPCAV